LLRKRPRKGAFCGIGRERGDAATGGSDICRSEPMFFLILLDVIA